MKLQKTGNRIGVYKRRDNKGRFAKAKNLIKGMFRAYLSIMFLLIAGFGIFFYGVAFNTPESIKIVHVAEANNNVDSYKLEAKMELILDDLQRGEAPSYKDGDILITYDPPSKLNKNCKYDEIYSHGAYQLKLCTIEDVYSRYKNEDITAQEALQLAHNPVTAREFARYFIFDTTGGIFHWKNTAIKYDLIKRVTEIKEQM